MSSTEVDTSPAVLEERCSNCNAPMDRHANFCSTCGSPTVDQTDSRSLDKPVGSRKKVGVRFILIWTFVGMLLLAMNRMGIFEEFWHGFVNGLSGMDLSVEIFKVPTQQEPAAQFGYVRITNRATDPITLKSVSINHRKDANCLFKAGSGNLTSSPLAQGEDTMLGTVSSLLGGCGSIVVVTVDTDKGLEDYDINWR